MDKLCLAEGLKGRLGDWLVLKAIARARNSELFLLELKLFDPIVDFSDKQAKRGGALPIKRGRG